MAVLFRILTLLGFTVCLSVGQDLNLEIAPRGTSHTRALGASIVFTCTATGISQGTDPRLEWYDQEDRAVEDRTGRMYIEKDGHSLKMYISSIEARDAGKYMCKGTIEGNRVEQATQLLLFKDITFEHAPSPQNPVLNRKGLIECRVSGQPVPTVSWRYRGQKIISGGRYTYLPEGLEIQNAQETDNGMYTCRAEVASDGRLKETPIQVIVHIPPVVTKELGQAEGIEEQEVSLTCKASGKPEPKYEFYRLTAGVATPVIPSDRIQIDRDLGAINFRPLKKADEGDYECKAINDAGDTSTKGFLKVVVPPRIIDLKNVTALEGDETTLQCVIKGDPAPSITFQKQGTSRPYEDGDNEGGRVKVVRVADNALELRVKNLSPDDTANYTCRAENIGGDHLLNGTIIVEFKPRFDPDHIKQFWSWPDKTRNMTCTALGEPEPVVDWYLHDLDRPIQNNASFKVYKMGRNSVLQVKIRDEDQGWIYDDYQCKAGNKHGQGTTIIELKKATIPGKPRASEVKEESPTMVVLTVQPPEYNGGIEIYGYRVEYESRSQDFKIGEEIRIENLRPSTNYIFRIRAKNEVGVGPYLDYTHTTEAIRSPYPINIISKPEGEFPYSYVIKWEKPKTGGLPIKEYEFKYRRVQVNKATGDFQKPLEDWTKLIVQEDINSPRLFYTLNRLNPNSHYEAQVMARNDIGRSSPNPQFIFTTADGDYLESSTKDQISDKNGVAPVTSKDPFPTEALPPDSETVETGVMLEEARHELGLTTGGIIGIIFAVFVIFLLIVDISCYFMNDCGVLMCLRLRICGKRSSASKDKMMEEGERDLVIEQHIEETKAAPPPEAAHILAGEDEKKIPAPDHDAPVLRQPMADASNMTPRTIWKNVMQDLRDRLQTDDEEEVKGDVPQDQDEADEKSPLTADTKEAAEEGKEAVESPDVRSGELEPEDKPEPEVPLSAEPPVIA